jgi:hypothetical protein
MQIKVFWLPLGRTIYPENLAFCRFYKERIIKSGNYKTMELLKKFAHAKK